MMNVNSLGRVVLLLLVVALVVGCQPAGADRPATFKVTGTVTMGGAPLEGASVMFVPKTPPGNAASGITDASGKYALSTFGGDDGAVPGDYFVVVRKYEAAAPATGGTAAPAGGEVEQDADFTGEAVTEEGAKNLLPEKYASPATSGFTATVEAKDNSFDFPLEGGEAPKTDAAPKE
jgi:hypothetical protein